MSMRRTNKHRRRTPKRESIAPQETLSANESGPFEASVPSRVPTLAPPPPILVLPPASPPSLPDPPRAVAHHSSPPEVQRFFDEPVQHPIDEDQAPVLEIDEEVIAERVARRRRFTRIASIVVAMSGLLCAFAFVRVLVVSEASAPARAATPIVAAPPTPVAVPVTTRSPVRVAAQEAMPVASAMGPAPPSAPAALPLGFDLDAARRERFEAQAALEIGDIKRAAIVAQRAVAHDPSEAEGWLLLTAAQLEMKDDVGANRSLNACAQRATRGPRGECVALIQTR